MTSLAATGYASIDYVVGLEGEIVADQTTLVSHRDPAAWPRAGGCPVYVAAAAAAAGRKAHAICWVGDDAAGDGFKQELVSKGVEIDGVATMAGRCSPTAILAYQSDRGCACLFDPVFPGEERLDTRQEWILRDATHICITAGPPHLMTEILRFRGERVRLYWVLKRDLHAFPAALCDELSSQADVIFCNASERDLVGRTARDTVIVQTGNEDRITLETGYRRDIVEIERLDVSDTTGAGDTLAGGFIAAAMASNADPIDALRLGMQSARRLLKARMPVRMPEGTS
ncbi:MAG: PfkB family carbohydrate kinase [Rhodobacteraceae bacterium]|nr:PfkB family carbohydrate kinase [Paracoccaceae bacterium]